MAEDDRLYQQEPGLYISGEALAESRDETRIDEHAIEAGVEAGSSADRKIHH
jgi:hypothetical protein